MRLDHIAYRVADRYKSSKFFQDAFGYTLQQEFEIDFGNGQFAKCIALDPPERLYPKAPWVLFDDNYEFDGQEYHRAPEIFISDGTTGSIVGDWVAARGGIGGIHHMAYQVVSVQLTMNLWKEKGYAEFTSEEPMRCPGLTQIFTKPSELTGVIYEFIERSEFGFCCENVKSLMLSTRELSSGQTSGSQV